VGLVVVSVRVFVLIPLVEARNQSFYLRGAVMRSGASDLDFPEVQGPHGRLIDPGRL